MPLTNPNKIVTEERLNEYHRTILPYLGGNSMVACGGGYAPIGTVISYMGTRAPSDFLICDGTVYNIADYTELADFFEAQFGSNNFFGGDGNTTFAVPDLRGEFLRGTGTNSHANQGSGDSVGVHQDGTLYNQIASWTNGGAIGQKTDNSTLMRDFEFASGTFNRLSAGGDETSANWGLYTSRPTNTSVLYCIKAKSQGNGYSLDEQIVGTWIDGKPIYQKTIITKSPNSENGAMNIVPENVEKLLDIQGSMVNRNNDQIVFRSDYSNITMYYPSGTTRIEMEGLPAWGRDVDFYITLQYTKTD